MPQLTQDQIDKLKSLGIEINDQPTTTSPIQKAIPKDNLSSTNETLYQITPEETNLNNSPVLPLNNQQSFDDLTKSPQTNDSILLNNYSSEKIKFDKPKSNVFPLLSISGLTLLSLSGLILFKNKDQADATPVNNSNTTLPETSVSPTQVPKSIQHYLLTSQQFFTSASTKSKDEGGSGQQAIDDLNQSIVAATEAIKEFPNDYRGYYQRGRIYQSVASSQPQVITQVLADLSQAQKLNPNDAEITRSLASAYAIKGDAQNTINYLSQTIALEPTKAQNFYDLAKIQQQVGLLPQAIETYDKLLSILSDPTQKTQVQSEKSEIEKIIAQNPNRSESSLKDSSSNNPVPTISLPSSLDSPTIQASAGTGLIVAAPEKLDQIEVSNLTSSNSLSGASSLSSGQKEVTITNSQVTDKSQVYVSILSGGKNQNLQVLSKSTGSFIVGLDSPINETIEFKWWIIN
jgi:tetratricopeptide (TPR) repeat protein